MEVNQIPHALGQKFCAMDMTSRGTENETSPDMTTN